MWDSIYFLTVLSWKRLVSLGNTFSGKGASHGRLENQKQQDVHIKSSPLWNWLTQMWGKFKSCRAGWRPNTLGLGQPHSWSLEAFIEFEGPPTLQRVGHFTQNLESSMLILPEKYLHSNIWTSTQISSTRARPPWHKIAIQGFRWNQDKCDRTVEGENGLGTNQLGQLNNHWSPADLMSKVTCNRVLAQGRDQTNAGWVRWGFCHYLHRLLQITPDSIQRKKTTAKAFHPNSRQEWIILKRHYSSFKGCLFSHNPALTRMRAKPGVWW